ncbi:MAG TPA: CUAEP/CCAEP-tail radical SAM protein [Candidatus Sulfomarinibacteraceae bacterium]|nr:CUAEP/CCAEP-tail radical SAM protein [Candidatus Sulfomarinibacteraceae bacterium]
MYKVLLLACYELGHQPLSLAWPAAFLRQDGRQVTVYDLAVTSLGEDAVRGAVREADFVGVAVPMHTAMRLGVQAGKQVRALNPEAHICFFGLYAMLNADYLQRAENGQGPLADSVIAGEYEEPLRKLVATMAAGEKADEVQGVSTPRQQKEAYLERLRFPVPDRRGLPALNNYAHYMYDGTAVPAGYVEASRGCLHTCRHCPVVPVYGGRFFVTPLETVMADVRQQVAAGARHITFGDPDFLNGPGHALKVAQALQREFPDVTFDFTTKVEHILERRELFAPLYEAGARFVVSALESTSDFVLERLQKGHTLADMDEALQVLDEADLYVQPTWLPFTPWTTLDDYLHMLHWIRQRNLISHVPMVQLSIRLLVPPRSALLDHPDVSEWLGPLDQENFTYEWRHPDPRMDELQQEVTALAGAEGGDAYAGFAAVERAAYEMAGREAPAWTAPVIPDLPPPRLTEDWFC